MNENSLHAVIQSPAKLQFLKGRFNSDNIVHTISYVIFGIWFLFLVGGLGWVLIASLSTTREIFSDTLMNTGLHFENYTKVLFGKNLIRYFFNSIMYVFLPILLLIFLASPASYVLSRGVFRGRNFILMLFVAAMAIPAVMLMIPIFINLSKVNLVNTTSGLVIIYIGISIPFSVFFLTGFFRSLPVTLEEAALIDGAGEVQTFWKIMFPLAQPGIITICIFNFVSLWNDYFWALIFVNTENRKTLMLGVENILRTMRYTGNWASLFAATMVLFLPTFILYLFLSEKIIAGVTAGSIKG